jgi:hypothetical protein
VLGEIDQPAPRESENLFLSTDRYRSGSTRLKVSAKEPYLRRPSLAPLKTIKPWLCAKSLRLNHAAFYDCGIEFATLNPRTATGPLFRIPIVSDRNELVETKAGSGLAVRSAMGCGLG